MVKLLVVLGTRPEAVKLCPLILHLRCRAQDFHVKVCATSQHRSMLEQILRVFQVKPDYDLDVMQPGQSLCQSMARIMSALDPVLEQERPEMVVVQGDTTTTLAGALAAFYHKVPVGHVEAGLRTGDLRHPFPEEMNRVMASRLSGLHFAPTLRAEANLLGEGIAPAAISVTGNSGIDAVLHVRDGLESGRLQGFSADRLDPSRKLIVVTAHRRESFGEGFERICAALARLAARSDVQIAYPVHRNPHVREPVYRRLGSLPNVVLLDPLDYVTFVDLMRRAYLLLTDSGGIQEEGPSLGKPILVMREKTERPEAVEAGTVKLVGTDETRILWETYRLLDDPAEYERMSRVHNPYGDGRASVRIAEAIWAHFRPGGKAADNGLIC